MASRSAESLGNADQRTAWGKPAYGLQAGIRLPQGTQPVRSGDAAEFELVVRNVQDRGVASVAYPEGIWYAGEAENGVVTLGAGSVADASSSVRHLEPGEEVVVGRAFLGLPGSNVGPGHLIELPAGEYQVGSDGALPQMHPSEVQEPGVRYSPALRTGYLSLTLEGDK